MEGKAGGEEGRGEGSRPPDPAASAASLQRQLLLTRQACFAHSGEMVPEVSSTLTFGDPVSWVCSPETSLTLGVYIFEGPLFL